MNPDTGAIYPSIAEARAAGEKREDLVLVTGRQEQIDKMISGFQMAQAAKDEKRRQNEKNRRVAVEAGRRMNRRKR